MRAVASTRLADVASAKMKLDRFYLTLRPLTIDLLFLITALYLSHHRHTDNFINMQILILQAVIEAFGANCVVECNSRLRLIAAL